MPPDAVLLVAVLPVSPEHQELVLQRLERLARDGLALSPGLVSWRALRGLDQASVLFEAAFADRAACEAAVATAPVRRALEALERFAPWRPRLFEAA